ncbi:MAG: SAM-dependent chlorinase/fluorinase [Bacteroidia bacterium]|nr:SAM-dependent chlorinase/fluorinase [Bacteroidia bacterium]
MPIITLTTDFGIHSHFVAELKGKLYGILPQCTIIDISHAISPFQFIETAFILKNSIFHFPAKTIHTVGVDSSLDIHKSIIIAEYNEQFIIAADNGIIPLILDESDFSFKKIEINKNDYFSFKNIFPQYIKNLIENEFDLNKIEGNSTSIKTLVNQKPVYYEDKIMFNIIYFDNFGNAYTNLTKSFFEDAVKSRKFIINLSKQEKITIINKSYTDVKEGEFVCFFDENNYMVIAINKNRADNLLGLRLLNNQYLIEII